VTAVEGDQAGAHAVVHADGRAEGPLAEGPLAASAREAATEALERERNSTVESDGSLLFVEALVPPPRVVIVGAVDTAESLAAMAHRLGWRTVVVDPRAKFATDERIPSADQIVVRWPEQGYEEIDLRPEDAV